MTASRPEAVTGSGCARAQGERVNKIYVLGNKKAIAVFLAPALLVYVGVMVVPVVWSLVCSSYQGNPILGFEFTGFDNSTKLFTDNQTRQDDDLASTSTPR